MLSIGIGTFNLPLLFTDRQSNGNTECVDYMRLGSKHTANALLILDAPSADTDFCPEVWRGRGVWVESKQIYEYGPEPLLPQHAQIHIEPDVNNGALRMQIREYGWSCSSFQFT